MSKSGSAAAASGRGSEHSSPADSLGTGIQRQRLQIAWGVSALLAVAANAVYAQVRSFEFVSYDDPFFVTGNQRVLAGVTPESVAWAFTSIEAFWHPLTWLSHMLDVQLYGAWAGGHHLTNLVWHAAAVVLLFWAWFRLTDDLWPSALVAAIFAFHPLHAESVSWVSERKGVLSSFFYIAALWAYAGYVRRPSVARYLLVTAALCLGLMSKPTLVTLPCVLLLLDYWPLGRLRLGSRDVSAAWSWPCDPRPLGRLLLEKLPWLLLAVAASFIAVLAEEEAGALDWIPGLSWPSRVCNALIVPWLYLGKFFWPAGLMFFYPHPGNDVSRLAAAAGALAIVAVLALAVWQMRRRPYLLVGWLWYLGTLVPVLGLVQVGGHRMADRYTDIPLIGVSVALAWGLAELQRKYSKAAAGFTIVAAAALLALAGLSWLYAGYWHDSEALYRRALAIDGDNWVALSNLGLWLDRAGRNDEALAMHRRAIKVNPDNAAAVSNLASSLLRQGRIAEAIERLHPMAVKQPGSYSIRANLGLALFRAGRMAEAEEHFLEAIRLRGDSADVRRNYGLFLARRGQVDEAIAQFHEAIALQPGQKRDYLSIAHLLHDYGRYDEAVAAYSALLERWPKTFEGYEGRANAQLLTGNWRQAVDDYRRAIEIDPQSLPALLGLIWILSASPDAGVRDGAAAVRAGEHACGITQYADAQALDALAAANAEIGKYPRAIELAERARQQARLRGEAVLAQEIEKRIALYRQGEPYRGPAPAAPPR